MIKNTIIAVMIILFILGNNIAIASNGDWQVLVEQRNSIIPTTKNLGVGMTRSSSSMNSFGVSIKRHISFAQDKDDRRFKGCDLFLNYGKGDLNFEYDYGTSATKFDVLNSYYLGWGVEAQFVRAGPWNVLISVMLNYGTITDSDINYTSYRAGLMNFARKIKGTWLSDEIKLGLIYNSDPWCYFWGLDADSRNFELIYYDYPLTPGAESSSHEHFGNSSLYAGFKYAFLERGSLSFKYVLPINKDWLQGYEIKVGWGF